MVSNDQRTQAEVLEFQQAPGFSKESFHSQLAEVSKGFSIIQILNF